MISECRIKIKPHLECKLNNNVTNQTSERASRKSDVNCPRTAEQDVRAEGKRKRPTAVP
jgi:hypothetical protein